MNNIEMEALKRDLKKYLKYSDDQLDNLHKLNESKLIKLKRHINEKKCNYKNKLEIKKIEPLKENVKPKIKQDNKLEIKKIEPLKENVKPKPKPLEFQPYNQEEMKHVEVIGRKPRIVFITDVKGWAWWIKSEYLKKYLSDEFDIDIINVINDDNTMQYGKIDQSKYDLYFSYGYSYVSFLSKVPKKKKVTGITAHRLKNVIFPMMKIAEHHHANSIMLLKELQNMGFKRAYYVPNGVDEELFKPIKPINPKTELICGHVGKECHVKGQREFILPAIKISGCKSITNLKTWKNRIPHKEMPKIYNEMDVFLVSSIEDGTPNPALEAAACGRPIISNYIGNMPEFIKDGYNGFIVPRKINAYVDKINYFKQHPDEIIRMGENARKSILEEWTWKNQAENYRKMFKDIFKMNRG